MAFRFSSIQRLLSKLPGFSRPDKHPLAFLNVAQFTGVINDNIYKLILIFFLIELQGPSEASTILSTAGAVFVIPFLLFSSFAGTLADRFSKSRLLMIIKATEVLLFICITAAFAFKMKGAGYLLLFFLSTHSAMFGPSKYGIIPELVPKSQVSKGNGLITSCTYLAIIIGTFLASFLTEVFDRNFVWVASCCLLFATVGFLSTFGIPYTPPKGSHTPLNFSFVRQIFLTLRACKRERHLLVAISGSSFFLFIGAYTQLNIIPFAMQSLDLTEVAGGYLFLSTALGIAFGAFVAGRASKAVIELGLSCLSGLFIALLFVVLSFSAHQLLLSIAALFILGFFGGCFVVPLDSYIQLFSPEETRGHVIAATNFLSFCGVLLASLALYVFNSIGGLTAASSFLVMALLTFLFALFLILRLSDLFFSYLARKIALRFVRLEVSHLSLVETYPDPVLVLEEASPFKAWLLSGFVPNLLILLPHRPKLFPRLQQLCYSMRRIPSDPNFSSLVDKAHRSAKTGSIPCLYFSGKVPEDKRGIIASSLFKKESPEFILVKITRIRRGFHALEFKLD